MANIDVKATKENICKALNDMTKELSIVNIKKELINKISDNSEILDYFEKYLRDNESREYYLKEYGMKYIKDNYIFAHDMSISGYNNFISVEVTESEKALFDGGVPEKYYNINIMVALEDKDAIDAISVILGNIATELYPNRFNYKNTVYNNAENGQLARVVQFTIK